MKKSLKLFLTDLKNICTNWVALVLIGGLIVLPSFYALFNIYASWDPYSQTDQLLVAVVNEDDGASIRGKEINVGNELINILQTNKSMGWKFTTKSDAIDKVTYGDYFAAIIIPNNFSEKLATVASNSPKKGQVDYYVNEKINSIAPKITEKGATVIVEQMSSKFISTVNGVIFDIFNKLGIEIQRDINDIEIFKRYIFLLEKHLPEINDILIKTNDDLFTAQKVIKKANELTPKAEQIAKDGVMSVNNMIDFISKTADNLNKLTPQIEKDLEKVLSVTKEINDLIEKIEMETELKSDVSEIRKNIESIDSLLAGLEKRVEQLKKVTTTEEDELIYDEMLVTINEQRDFFKKIESSLDKLTPATNKHIEEVEQHLKHFQQLTSEINANVETFVNDFQTVIIPRFSEVIVDAKQMLVQVKSVLIQTNEAIPEANKIIVNIGEQLNRGEDAINFASNNFPLVNNKVTEIANKIRKFEQDITLNDIIELLINDPQAERTFFEEPIQLHETKLFPIENYGAGMTPFYTILSIWVGCLLLISLLAVQLNGDGTDSLPTYSSREVYVGRLLTFLLIGFMQTLIITFGCLFILRVKIEEPLLFILIGLFISFVFMTIVYTLVSVLGDVGKALAIVILVLQIAGSGGTYPAALLPSFFQKINPLLPFKYGIDMIRETVGGVVWIKLLSSTFILSFVAFVFIIFGLIFKEKINKNLNTLLKKSRESGLFH